VISKMDLREMCCEDGRWIELAQDLCSGGLGISSVERFRVATRESVINTNVSITTPANNETSRDYRILSQLPEDRISTCVHFHLQPQAKDTPSTRLVRAQYLQPWADCPSRPPESFLVDSVLLTC
jgi:hypothetical protein